MRTERQTRKPSRVKDFKDEAIHAKGTSIEMKEGSVGMFSSDPFFLAKCWEILARELGCPQKKVDMTRFQDVVLFKASDVEVEE